MWAAVWAAKAPPETAAGHGHGRRLGLAPETRTAADDPDAQRSPEGRTADEDEQRAHGLQGLHLLTVRGVVAFLALFGWGGLWLNQIGLPPLLALFLAVPIGFAGMVGIALIVREALRLQYDGTLDSATPWGGPARSTSPSPPAALRPAR